MNYAAYIDQTLIDLIKNKLEANLETLIAEYNKNKGILGIGFVAIDDLLPFEIASQLYEKFNLTNSAWREMSSFREKKLTSKDFNSFDKSLGEVTFAIQNHEVIKIIEKIVGMENLVGDDRLYAGGLSSMRQNDFLNPHIDNSHDADRKLYRRLNLLYYVTPDWNNEDGGHLELWDEKVIRNITIESRFNRLVLMEVHSTSWHSVSKVLNTKKSRCCVSNYYFSKESPSGSDYFHITSFNGRPNETSKRIICKIDNFARSFARIIKKKGFGKLDVFISKV